jgi:polyphenol oxidase
MSQPNSCENAGLITPHWPAPRNIRAVITTRLAPGHSVAPYDALNLGSHVHDAPAAVAANRACLVQRLQLSQPIAWLDQVHGTAVADLDALAIAEPPYTADASVCRTPNHACAVLTADCLPVLLCSQNGDAVGAAHAGWRGLLAGVLEATVRALATPETLMAYLGPAIGPHAFEVGPEVRDAFLANDATTARYFTAGVGDRFYADLAELAAHRLRQIGVQHIYASRLCTVTQRGPSTQCNQFYSHRRDGARTGRFASIIWRAE